MVDLNRINSAGAYLLDVVNSKFQHPEDAVYEGPNPLPIARATDSPNAPSESDSRLTDVQLASRAAQGKLLVVDDNEANRDVLGQRLKRQNHRVEVAESGQEALSALRDQEFDLVLLDIMMPQMDGYEVLKQIKGDDTLKHIPVLMVTALNELDSVVRCIEMGADDYLSKPINATLLKARVGACLEKKQAHDRERKLNVQLQQSFLRLKELEKLRLDLTDMIAHDVRTPLSSIFNGMQTLNAVQNLNSDQRKTLESVIASGEALLEMIRDLLSLEKLDSLTLEAVRARRDRTRLPMRSADYRA